MKACGVKAEYRLCVYQCILQYRASFNDFPVRGQLRKRDRHNYKYLTMTCNLISKIVNFYNKITKNTFNYVVKS